MSNMENLTFIENCSGRGKGFQNWTFIVGEGLKSHLAFYYADGCLLGFLTWDDFEEFAESFSTDVEDWNGLDKIPPMTEIDIDGVTYVKVK